MWTKGETRPKSRRVSETSTRVLSGWKFYFFFFSKEVGTTGAARGVKRGREVRTEVNDRNGAVGSKDGGAKDGTKDRGGEGA